jgi:formylglycine-generating enzyme required for sulfatase activity
VAGNAYASWIEWPNITTNGSLAISPFPSSTGISGASSWTSSKGIGMIVSNPAETVTHALLRGGAWYDTVDAGVLSLNLFNPVSNINTYVGFRVSK